MLKTLIERYWQVSTFKETPANTPYSLLLLIVIAILFYVLIIIQWLMIDVDGTTLLAGLALLISYGLYTYAILYLFHVPSRTVQTLTCLFAGHTIVHLFASPLLLLAPWLAASNTVQPVMFLIAILYLIFTFALTIWQFMITVHVYKHALAIDYLPAVLASFGLVACNVLIVSFWR